MIEALGNDKTKLEEENKQLKIQDQKCLNCYPPLRSNANILLNQWRLTNSKSRFVPPCISNVECSNRFEKLPHENSEVEARPITDFPAHRKHQNSTGTRRTQRPPIQKPNQIPNNDKPQLVVLADSHGHDLGNLLQQRTLVNVTSFVRPGAKFDQVTHGVAELTRSMNKSDHLLVIAGTNNMETTGIKRLLDGVHKLIQNSNHTNLILATVPMRYDQPNLDLKISRVNMEIEQIANNYPDIKLLPLHLFPQHLYTARGLHMNRKGKIKIAEMILKTVRTARHILVEAPIEPVKEEDKITVLEEDMDKVMDKYLHDPSAGFAHTISSDFHNTEKHMSAGVAVVFRRN